MKYWLDTEFSEQPCTIDLISIGIVSEDDRELYLVSNRFDPARCNKWVRKNVWPKLPSPKEWVSLPYIRDEVLRFVGDDKPEFWGYYADYDWVVFCWLFGTMVDLPKGWPMYCRDIKQLCDDLGNPRLPPVRGEHNALADARWNRAAWEMLDLMRRGH